jgi:hypothetical protein
MASNDTRRSVRPRTESGKQRGLAGSTWIRRMGVWLALLTLGLASCSSDTMLESQNVGPDRWQPIAGTSYYLPKKLLRIQVWRYGVDAEEDENGKPYGEENGAPKTKRVYRHFAMHAKDGSDELVIPDHRHQFVIKPKWDAGSHDYLKVSMAPDGLLSEVHGDAADERTEIAAGIGDLFSMLVSGNSESPRRMGSGDDMRALTDEASTAPRFVAEYEFDPVDPTDRARVDGALAKYKIKMGLTRQPDCPVATSGAGCCQTCDVTKPGIYYRLPIPYRFTLSPAGIYREPGVLGANSDNGEWESLEGGMEYTILLPNEAICLYVPVTRAAFVKAHTSVRFDRGMLTEVESDKPSEMLAFVKIPIDAASAILAIPAELLTVRIKKTEQKTDLAAQQQAKTDAERQKLESQIELLDAARKLNDGSTSGDDWE